MKKLMGILLAMAIVLGGLGNVTSSNAQVIQKGNKTYITLDKTEIQQNKQVLKESFKIKKFNVSTTKNTYTVKYNSNKNAATTKKQVKQIADKLHGSDTIEKKFKEFRTYKIKVIGIDKQGKSYTTTVNGHKIAK
ncbi:hypothetical protein [Terrisporobacter sp.]|uniref:hypothetical protein n=1 Tax=Terrisporobacter sp. TaxID=1965305 RepID=UPI00289BDC33|nr:hypothetical protein [Terrisporobacter sp.]